MRTLRAMARVAVGATLLAAALLPAAPAHATASCKYSTCEGGDPDASGCREDEEVLQTVNGQNAAVKLMRSRACGATWAEVQVLQGSNYAYAYLWSISGDGGIENAKGTTVGYEFRASYPYMAWSKMRDWHKSVRVCDQYGPEDRARWFVPSPTGGDDNLGSICGLWF